MIITSAITQKNNPDRKSIYIDGQYSFSIDLEDWFKLGLHEGKSISSKEIKNIVEVCNFTKAKNKAIRFISYKIRTEFEIANKLKREGFDEIVIEKVINHLKKLKYVDDEVYAQKYINDAINLKKIGTMRIYRELKLKGVDEDIISRKINEIDYDEKELLISLVNKKMNSLKEIDLKSLNRVKGYFIRRGYKLSDINKCINQVLSERDD